VSGKGKIGKFEYLSQFNDRFKKEDAYKRLYSLEFSDLPVYKTAFELTNYLKDYYFLNTLVVGKASIETDLAWLLKDFTANLDYLSKDFSEFQPFGKFYNEIHFINADFLSYEFVKHYDLVVFFLDLLDFYENLYDNLIKLSSIITSNATLIFILNFNKKDLTFDDNELILKKIQSAIPFQLVYKSKLESAENQNTQVILIYRKT